MAKIGRRLSADATSSPHYATDLVEMQQAGLKVKVQQSATANLGLQKAVIKNEFLKCYPFSYRG